MDFGSGHAPSWPQKFTQKDSRHVLAGLAHTGENVYTLYFEDSEELFPVSTFVELKSVVKSKPQGVDLYWDTFDNANVPFPFLDDVMNDLKIHKPCSKDGRLGVFHIRQGNHWTRISSFDKWQTIHRNDAQRATFLGRLDVEEGRERLARIREICNGLGIGIQPSPAAVGSALLVKLSGAGKLITVPRWGCVQAMQEYAQGGRAEHILNMSFDKSYCIDINNAYGSCCNSVPVGTTRIFHGRGKLTPKSDALQVLEMYYAQCAVVINSPLKVGIFGIRDKKQSDLTYPTEPGVYGQNEKKPLWLWKHEAEECVRLGCTVKILRGYGWTEMSNRFIPYAHFLAAKRNQFRDSDRPELETLTKKILVAGLGCFGSSAVKRSIVTRKEVTLGDKRFKPFCFRYSRNFEDLDLRFFIKTEVNKRSNVPIHVYKYIISQCNFKLYKRQLAELESGNTVIATNFDGMYTTKPTILPTGTEMGEWKISERTDADFPYTRAIVSKEETKLPGVKLDMDERMKYKRLADLRKTTRFGHVPDRNVVSKLQNTVYDTRNEQNGTSGDELRFMSPLQFEASSDSGTSRVEEKVLRE